MLVWLVVQVLAADRAEAGAVGTAEDLLRNLERDGIAHPRSDTKLTLDHVVGAEIVTGSRVRVVELTGEDVRIDSRRPEAAHAGADEACPYAEVDHRRGAGLGHLELGHDACGVRLVPLTPEKERLQLDVESLTPHLAGA